MSNTRQTGKIDLVGPKSLTEGNFEEYLKQGLLEVHTSKMKVEIFHEIDDKRIDTSIIKKDFSEVFHLSGIALIITTKMIRFLIGEGDNYHQVRKSNQSTFLNFPKMTTIFLQILRNWVRLKLICFVNLKTLKCKMRVWFRNKQTCWKNINQQDIESICSEYC